MSKEAMKLALEALFTYEDDWVEDGMGGVHHNVIYDEKKIFKAITALRIALAEQPAQPEWIPVTQELLNSQHPWLYEQLWIAMKDGTVLQGIYEWRQGRYPDRFLTDAGSEWAFDADYVMPIVKPTLPAIEAAHGIKENT